MAKVEEDNFSIRQILDLFWRLRLWIVLSVVAALVAAFFVVRISPTKYRMETWVMLNTNAESATNGLVLPDLYGVNAVNKRIDNEIFILRSPSMMSKVINELGLNYRYFQYGSPIGNRISLLERRFDIKSFEYYKVSPFSLEILHNELLPESERISSVSLSFRHKTDSTFLIQNLVVSGREVDVEQKEFHYGRPIHVLNEDIKVNLVFGNQMKLGVRYLCSWTKPEILAQSFVNNLSVDIQGQKVKYTDVVIVSYTDPLRSRASDVLNSLVEISNREARDYSNIVSRNTIDFIDERMKSISQELGNAEANFKDYQAANSVYNFDSQSQYAISSDQRYREQLNEVKFQIEVIQMVSDNISGQKAGKYEVIPANVGVADEGLNVIINNYNDLVTERARMVANSSESNPRVLSMDTQLDAQKRSIEASVANLQRIYTLRLNEITKNLSTNASEISKLPVQQVDIQQLGRRLDIIEPLYVMLQTRREEAEITMYSHADTFRVLESAFGGSAPISPNRTKIYLLAFILSLLVAPAYVLLREQLRSKVETKEDISDRMDTPIIVSLVRNTGSSKKLVPMDSRSAFAESLRMLCSNMRYLPDTKVIQVTSSVPGEGKSFVSSNFALMLSSMGKKVLLIGFDIRKPALHKFFGNVAVSNEKCLSSYLTGNVSDLSTLPHKSGLNDNLDIIFAGRPVPNPVELLSRVDLSKFINYFRNSYDYIIIDSAPYLPIPDPSIINDVVDTTFYVVRVNYTELKVLDSIKELTSGDKATMKNANIIINDMDFTLSKYRYGYGYGYGYYYGHGYGYGYGYGEEGHKRHHKSDMKKLNGGG